MTTSASHLTTTPYHYIQTEQTDNGWLLVTLKRDNALQALNTQMVTELLTVLQAAAIDNNIHAIFLQSNTPKAFCAGGDVRSLRHAVVDGTPTLADKFFAAEYQLDLAIRQFCKPIVVWGDGYVMGGGMGIFMAADFRVATSHSKFAMPEIAIGLFPDVGASRYLANNGSVGLFLGTTGSMVSSSGAQALAWASHVCEDKTAVLTQLLQLDWQTADNGCKHHCCQKIANVLNQYHCIQPPAPIQLVLSDIQSICQGHNFNQDYQNLIKLTQHSNPWLKQAGESIKAGAPSTVALTWLLWQWATKTEHATWEQVYALEYELACFKVRHADFAEGVRARLVDKDLSPQWQIQYIAGMGIDDILPQLPKTHDATWQQLLTHYGIQAI